MTDAQRLAAAFTGDGPIDHLDNRPQDVAAGYALQDGVRAALGRPVIGWKLAQTVPAAQKAAGIEAPTVSPLLEGMIVHADTEFPSRQFYKPEAEAEIAIELKDAIDRPSGRRTCALRQRGSAWPSRSPTPASWTSRAWACPRSSVT